MRPEPSQCRDAEEQLGGDVVGARLQDPHGVVRLAEEARLQSREELETAVDSGRSAKLGSAFSELPVDPQYGWDLASSAG